MQRIAPLVMEAHIEQIPIICIANDRTAQKMKPLQGSTFSLTFKRYALFRTRVRLCSQWL